MTASPGLRARADRVAHLTRRAYEFATVPRFRPRGGPVPATDDDLRLLFRPATGDWFVEHGARWYRPGDDHDLTVALTELAVEIVDESMLTTVPHAGEQVWINTVADGGPTVFDFTSSRGRFSERIERGAGSVPDDVVRWLDPVHPDGWVDLTAALWVTGVRHLTLETYLPPHEELGDKTMSISIDHGGRRELRTTLLTRGDPTTVPLYRGEAPAWGLRIGLHCQYPEPATDSRELGFQLVSIERRA